MGRSDREAEGRQHCLGSILPRTRRPAFFSINNPAFDTPEKRGEMISRVIRKQYNMVRSKVADHAEQYCVALYGEISELYKAGQVHVPDDVIKVWADNGYGKMVSRRHGNLNLRVPALPEPHEKGKHGIYYHVTFHDLQASNHLALFPAPADLIKERLRRRSGSEQRITYSSIAATSGRTSIRWT